MAELKIENFKYGLDSRRDDLVSQPGTLVTLNNGHINPGGECETRGQFTKDANLFPTNTLGLQDTDSGIVTFGSDASPNASLPSGVVYQQLVKPLNGGGNLATVLFSCSFRGKAFALVNFDNDTSTYGFYNGSIVFQITDGVVLFHPGGGGTPENTSDLAIDLAAIINRIGGWLADANVIGTPYDGINNLGYQERALTGSVMVMSPPGVHFTPAVANNNSVAGLLGVRLIDQNYPGVAAQSAIAAFGINAGTNGTVTLTAPANANGSGNAQLTNGAINFDTNIATTVTDIVNAVNNFTFITGYSAVFQGNNITIYAPASFGNVTFNLTVVTTGDITTVAGTPFAQVILTIVQATPVYKFFGSDIWGGSILVTAQVSGLSANGKPSFTWSQVDAQGHDITSPSNFFGLSSTTGISITVAGAFNPGTSTLIGSFRCTVTDSGNVNNKATVFFNVTLTHP